MTCNLEIQIMLICENFSRTNADDRFSVIKVRSDIDTDRAIDKRVIWMMYTVAEEVKQKQELFSRYKCTRTHPAQQPGMQND